MDTEHVGKVISVVARGTKRNPRKWVVKKIRSQFGALDQKLPSKTTLLYRSCCWWGSYDSVYWVRCSKKGSWLSLVELMWMNYERLDLLGRGYIGSRNGAIDLLSWRHVCCVRLRFVWAFLKTFGLVFQSVGWVIVDSRLVLLEVIWTGVQSVAETNC